MNDIPVHQHNENVNSYSFNCLIAFADHVYTSITPRMVPTLNHPFTTGELAIHHWYELGHVARPISRCVLHQQASFLFIPNNGLHIGVVSWPTFLLHANIWTVYFLKYPSFQWWDTEYLDTIRALVCFSSTSCQTKYHPSGSSDTWCPPNTIFVVFASWSINWKTKCGVKSYCIRKTQFAVNVKDCGYFVAINLFVCLTCNCIEYVIKECDQSKMKILHLMHTIDIIQHIL